ncbi:polysaccharide deacetylase family protein [Halosimplex halobium]|uniref:polysaccharide deacetylase family protein n=1 Tax=Halosimplex halobium TaxID=3396618 RepID=UPI003F548360
MLVSESQLLRAWRTVAFVGHFSGVESLSSRGTNKIVAYHSVGGGFHDDIAPDRLRRDIEYLDTHYELVDLPAVREPSDEKRIALIFEDGYRDFAEHVVPVLREYEVPATVFVIADAIDDPSFTHNDRFDYEYMDRGDLLALLDEELVTIGNHTRTHPKLAEVSPDRLEREIVGAKRRLERALGVDVDRFSYPYNSCDERAAELVRRSHDIGVAGRGRREYISADTDPEVVPQVNGANPFWEVRWDLSDAGTFVGSVADRLVGRAV